MPSWLWASVLRTRLDGLRVARPLAGRVEQPLTRSLRLLLSGGLIAAGLLACSGSGEKTTTTTTTTTASGTGTSASTNAATDTTPQPVLSNAGFQEPENLVYDARDSVYLVANINGDPRARDGNGFISKISRDGKMVMLKWIDGSNAATRLDGPKGLAIHGDTLVVADVGCVRLFDVTSGKALGVWKLPGVLMNDVAFGPDGTLYVTDTGPDSGKTATDDHDAIFHFTSANHATRLASGSDLAGPDGIMVGDSGVTYATFKANRVVRISRAGTRTTIDTLPAAKVDGLRPLPDGSFVATSWDARGVFRFMTDGSRRTELSGVDSPAGVAYDSTRHQLAITSMQGNTMYIVPLR